MSSRLSPTEKGIALAWRNLQEREQVRTYLSKRTQGERWLTQYPGPEYVFYSVFNSRSEANVKKNRYSNILAYDRSTVLVDGERYLNANVVVDPVGNWWVAAQAPLPHTHHDFFRAIQTRAASQSGALPKKGDENVKNPTAVVVQLTNWTERGFLKADPYLPTSSSEDRIFTTRPDRNSLSSNPLRVHLEQASARPEIGGVHSLLRVSDSNGSDDDMTVHHYLFEQWPDHGVPQGESIVALKQLLKEVHAQRAALGGQDSCELWVHCSAGIGRTGAFLALMSVNFDAPGAPAPEMPSPLGHMPLPKNGDDIALNVDTMRDYRNHLIQTQEQLQLVYEMSAGWSEGEI